MELLRRTTHAVELTEAGALLLERAPALLAEAEELWRAVGRLGSGEEGSLELAYGSSSAYETAPRLLTELAERLPGLRIATRLAPTRDIVDGVEAGTVEVGIVRFPPAAPRLESRVLRREPQGVLVPREHPLANQHAVELAALRDETLLVHPRDENPGHYDALLALCRTGGGFEPRLLERRVTFDLGQTPVSEGRAVTIVGASARPAAGSPLVWRPLTPPALLDVHLLVRAFDRSPATERFLETAAAVARELGWIAPGG